MSVLKNAAKKATNLWTASIRRQLIFGIIAVHAALMSLFVFDLVHRQQDFLFEQDIAQTTSMAETLAANSTVWVLSDDVLGLEEIVASQLKFPGLVYAMVIDPYGRVLAHTDRAVVGKYVADETSKRLLSADRAVQVLDQGKESIDLAAPVVVNDQQIAWARIAVSREDVNESLHIVTRNGILYTAAAIVIGILFAVLLARSMTGTLSHMATVAEQLSQTDSGQRITVSRNDELGILGKAFNKLADAVQARENELRQHKDNLERLVEERTQTLEQEVEEREQFQKAAQDSEARLRKILDSAPAGISVLTQGTAHRVYANARYLEMFGVESLTEIETIGFENTFVDPKDSAKAKDYIESGRGFARFVMERRNAQGGSWWALLDAVPVEFDGTPSTIVWHLDISDQKKAETELMRSEERTRQIVNSAGDGIVSLNENGDIAIFNAAAEKMFGYTAQEAIGQNVKILMPEVAAANHDAHVAQFKASDDTYILGDKRRIYAQRKSGEHFPVEIAVSTLFYGDDRMFTAIVRDITERIAAEDRQREILQQLNDSKNELQASEERLRLLLDSSPAGVSVLNSETRARVYANSRFLEMFAVRSSDELDEFGIDNTYALPEDWIAISAAIKDNEPFKNYVAERVKKNGERWWSLLDAVPMMFEGEQSVMVWHHDITDQKRSEDELSGLMESSPIGVSIIGREISERFYTNSRYLDLFGAKNIEELEAFGYKNSFVSDDDFKLALDHFETGIGPESSIMQRRRIDGEEWWAKIYAVPVEFRGFSTFIVWCIDITDQKNAEAELVQAEKMASLGGLVAGVAHEVNTPIGVSVTAVSHLKEQTESLSESFTQGSMSKKSLESYIDLANQSTTIIASNLHRAADLIRSFKQVAVDQSDESLRSFNLLEYIHEVARSLKPQLKKTPNISVAIDGDNSVVMESYPGPVAQILTNLIMNSVIHGFPGGEPGEISVTVQPQGKFAHIHYSDDGKGIAPENLNKIFDPFFTTNRGSGGSGLGMNVVYNLATRKLDGSIKCTSEPGKGVAFDILVPMNLENSA